MTLDNLIFILTDIRNQWPDSGKIPVVMEPSRWEDAKHRDGMVLPAPKAAVQRQTQPNRGKDKG